MGDVCRTMRLPTVNAFAILPIFLIRVESSLTGTPE
jgi:hypothetical protein